jgi:hypothetical protein
VVSDTGTENTLPEMPAAGPGPTSGLLEAALAMAGRGWLCSRRPPRRLASVVPALAQTARAPLSVRQRRTGSRRPGSSGPGSGRTRRGRRSERRPSSMTAPVPSACYRLPRRVRRLVSHSRASCRGRRRAAAASGCRTRPCAGSGCGLVVAQRAHRGPDIGGGDDRWPARPVTCNRQARASSRGRATGLDRRRSGSSRDWRLARRKPPAPMDRR